MVVMIHTTKVGPKGQVVIPKDLRDEFGILPGERVLVEDAGDAIAIKKHKRDSAEVFREIALSAPRIKMPAWRAIKKELEERFDKTGRE